MHYECIFNTSSTYRSAVNTTVKMTVYASNCFDSPRVYTSPLRTCNNPTVLFPGDPQWGTVDWFDTYKNDTEFRRTFYASTDGTCTTPTDTFTIPLRVKVGPMGDPRPCGYFELETSFSKKSVPKTFNEK